MFLLLLTQCVKLIKEDTNARNSACKKVLGMLNNSPEEYIVLGSGWSD
jgi:hypothetical protein